MKRAALLALWCVAVGGFAWVVWTHPGRDRVDTLEAELESLRTQNEDLAEQNRELQRRIQALRNDPRAIRRRARIAGGLARPNELIFQFDNPQAGGRLQVELVVANDQLQLAGKTFEMGELGGQLRRARRAFPTAGLAVRFDSDVTDGRRRSVLDTIRASAFRYRPDQSHSESRGGDKGATQPPEEG